MLKSINLISRRSCELYWAEPWLALWRALEARSLALELLAIHGNGNSLRLLDAGASDGRFFDLLSYSVELLAGYPLAKSIRGFGLERGRKRSLGMRKRGSPLVPICGDVTALPFDDHVMDVVLCNSTLEHIANVESVLTEFSRVLRPDGYLLFTVPSTNFEQMLLRYRLGCWIGEGQGTRLAQKKSARLHHFHYLHPQSWEQHLMRSSFSLISWRPIVPSRVVAWGDMLQTIRDVGIGGGYTSLRKPTGRLMDLPFRIVRRLCIELEVRIAQIACARGQGEVEEPDEGAYLVVAQRNWVNNRATSSRRVLANKTEEFLPMTVLA